MSADAPLVVPAHWGQLRRFTAARIALGRAGHSLPTAAHLAFQLAHAQARDAVHLPFESALVEQALHASGLTSLRVHSAAADRRQYLQRPDLGRRLDDSSRAALPPPAPDARRFDLAFAVVDGLSPLAVHRHAAAVVQAVIAQLAEASAQPWELAPVVIASQGRVALGDEIGERLGADLLVLLIGERPGLSSPDSLGAYLTWAPRVGRTDAERNCVSNIRPEGLPIDAAAAKIAQLLWQARAGRLTGVALKDEADDAPAIGQAAQPPGLNR